MISLRPGNCFVSDCTVASSWSAAPEMVMLTAGRDFRRFVAQILDDVTANHFNSRFSNATFAAADDVQRDGSAPIPCGGRCWYLTTVPRSG